MLCPGGKEVGCVAELTAKERAAAKGFSVIEGGRRGFIVDGINWGHVGDVLRRRREVYKIPLAELAELMEMPVERLEAFERGEIPQRNFCIRYRETLEAAREARR